LYVGKESFGSKSGRRNICKRRGLSYRLFFEMQRSKKVLLLVVGGGINRLEELAKNNKI
jgi:hypothetical protein